MRITAIVRLLGFCSVLLVSVTKGKECRYESVQLTIAIDNSEKISIETFVKVKNKVNELLKKNAFLPQGMTPWPYTISIHTFGKNVYKDDEVSGFMTHDTSELRAKVDRLSYHGDQIPRLSSSLKYFQERPQPKDAMMIYFYIGNGDDLGSPDRLMQRLENLLYRQDNVYVVAAYTDTALLVNMKLLKIMAINGVVHGLDDPADEFRASMESAIACVENGVS